MCKRVDPLPPPPPPPYRRRREEKGGGGVASSGIVLLARYLLGMIVASTFSAAYLLVPLYILSAALAVLLRYPDARSSLVYALPIFVSMLVPPASSRWALRAASPMLDYFDFESVHMTEEDDDENENENDDENDDGKKTRKRKRGRILAAQPHGVLTYVAMCEAIANPESSVNTPTAVASILLITPILRNLMGIFNLVDASGPSLRRHLMSGGGGGGGGGGGDGDGDGDDVDVDVGDDGGSCLLYVGGIAELFKSCTIEERLYLKGRKGFIKLALQTDSDVVPVYLFGNTSVLSVLRRGPLADFSRRFGVSLTYFWGKFYLPIPRDEKLLYVVGRPIGLPHIEHPTHEDIDKWHGVYCDSVRDIYETYRERVPTYKRKELYID